MCCGKRCSARLRRATGLVLRSNFLMYVTEPCSQRDGCVCNICIDSHVFDIVMMFSFCAGTEVFWSTCCSPHRKEARICMILLLSVF